MARRSADLQSIATVVGILAGAATLIFLERKRRGVVGDSCATTDDCQTGTHCVENKCVPFDPTETG